MMLIQPEPQRFKINYELPEKLDWVFETPHGSERYRGAYGGRGSSKSVSFASEALVRGTEQPLKILCARELQNSIKESIHAEMCAQIDRLELGWAYKYNETAIKSKINETEIIYKGLKHNYQSIKSIQGIDICLIEEAEYVSEQSWRYLDPTIRKPNSEIWAIWNPERIDSATKVRLLDNQPARARIVPLNWRDNPWFPEVLDELRQQDQRRDLDMYLHIWEGQCLTRSDAQILAGKCVVEAFTPGPGWDGPYFGADWGFSQDPTVLVKCWIYQNRLYVEHEAYGMRVEIKDIHALFDTIPGARQHEIEADNARPETISHVKRDGFKIIGCEKWKGSVEDGVAHLKGGYDKIVIHPRCVHTQEESRLYSFKVDRLTGQVMPDIIDKHNHCIAAGELVKTKRGQIPIEDVRRDDYVMTRKGWQRVTAAWKVSDDREIWKIKAGKYTLKATPDHKVFVLNKGFVRVDAISYNDVLLSNEELSCQPIESAPSSSKILNLWERFITATLLAKDDQTDYISRVKAASGCIEKSGNISQGKKFQKDFTSTTLTTIRSIMRLKILSAFHPRITSSVTLPALSLKKPGKNISVAFGISQKHGMPAQKGVKSIKKSAQWPTQNLCLFLKNAAIARKNFFQKKLETKTSTVQMRANQLFAGKQESTTKSEIVQSAKLPSKLTNIEKLGFAPVRVDSITVIGRSAVYDISVEGKHEFVVSGILVHNCIDAIRYALGKMIKRRNVGIMSVIGRK